MGYLPLDIKQPTTGWTTYVIHAGIFVIENFIMAEIFQPSDKIKLIFILFQQRTCMIKTRPKYPTDLYGTIYIDNIQKAVLCLIIPTIFPFGFSIKKIPGCMTYVFHPGSSIKRICITYVVHPEQSKYPNIYL